MPPPVTNRTSQGMGMPMRLASTSAMSVISIAVIDPSQRPDCGRTCVRENASQEQLFEAQRHSNSVDYG